MDVVLLAGEGDSSAEVAALRHPVVVFRRQARGRMTAIFRIDGG
ncbi:hypothetical protein [Nonomuraea sp. SBT364]|nr:hypothetical protein [Nonomuraea sp. SBT364]